MNETPKNTRLMGIFDVLFIMILCFATLLTTMLMQGGVLVGDSTSGIHYVFKISTFLVIVAGFVGYLIFIIPQSEKELRVMVKQVYLNPKEVKK
ncbi:hypothetical protein [Desulfosporosinus sp. Sb-LF]|uniref:hypothetical protein n=1 Tax=Desulfosporosinus sp. Sb-LF TaxID=2560027 RepID=UPI00107F44E8|nr:hypothetical protein [Desulfosporosinus sp. Sb-LF]TGE31828.1 hypothetical protein E4K68_14105 [Desulfosporosinus sp. Sb-LF]